MKKGLILIILLAFLGLNNAIGQWNAIGNNIYNSNSGNVGIGNNAPATLLYVAKSTTEPTITIQNLGGTGGATYSMVDNTSGAFWKFKATGTGGFKVRDQANALDVFVIEPNSAANALYINGAGYLGLGTAAPTVKLDVMGTIQAKNDNEVALMIGYDGRLKFGSGGFDYNSEIHQAGNDLIYNAFGDALYAEDVPRGGNHVFKVNENPSDGPNITRDAMVINRYGTVGIGTSSPAASAVLDLSSVSKGFLMPRMTQEQIWSITSPENGLQVFCTTDSKMYIYISSANQWKEVAFGAGTMTPGTCGYTITKTHVAGSVAPVNKTTSYGTVTNIPGETSKCWITSNLGSDHQASAVNDATEASAGWYWQFNRMQGYKHDGTTRTPNSTWITSINENSNWLPGNDPCSLELGGGWRIPTNTEWANVDASGGWTNWNGPWNSQLKIHAAGWLTWTDGSLGNRGSMGAIWASIQGSNTTGRILDFHSGDCYMNTRTKPDANPIRCIRN